MSSQKIKIIGFAVAFLTLLPSALAETVFTDLSSDNPHFQAIQYLHDKGVIQGYPDNTFRESQTVNRAEALKIILLGSDILVPEIQDQPIFPDVTPDVWYGKFALKAKNLGIVKGDDKTGFFRPGDTINLAEILKIITLANKIEAPAPDSNPFYDVSKDAWFAPYFEYARLKKLMDTSEDEAINPAQPVTRGLMAELMYRQAANGVVVPQGYASYYGEQFHGKTTASGEVFDASGFTAAHRTYPFNTWLKVTNAENGQSVVVRVTDRGPYAGKNRIIDLSKAAFEFISPLSRGLIPVSIEVTTAPSETPQKEEVAPSASNCPQRNKTKYLAKDTYENLTLSNEIPNQVVEGEVLILEGTTPVKTSKASAFLIDDESVYTTFYTDVADSRFKIPVVFPKAGTVSLGVIPSDAGQSIIQNIEVLDRGCLYGQTDISLTAPKELQATIKEGDLVLSWKGGDANFFELTLKQGTEQKIYYLHESAFTPHYPDFKSFKAGDLTVQVRSAKVSAKSPFEMAATAFSSKTSMTLKVDNHIDYTIEKDQVEVLETPITAEVGKSFKLTFKPKTTLRSKASIVLPTGTVEEVALTSLAKSLLNKNEIEIFPPSAEPITLTYTPKTSGLYLIEISNVEGLAAINIPLYPPSVFPLIPNPAELAPHSPVNLGTNLPKLQNDFLSLVNTDRSAHNLKALQLDANLNKLAQARAEDMITKGYFGHWDSKGLDANALRKNYGIQSLVSENLAKDLTLELAEYGLMQSATHRSNILDDEWTRAGFGIKRHTDGSYIFVQIFSTDPLNLSDLGSLRQELLSAINQKRSSPLILSENLSKVAQSWSDLMVTDDFFDFTSKSGTTLVDTIRNANIINSVGTYIAGNSSFADAKVQVSGNTQVKESRWSSLGIGITQDNLGIIKITLIYTE